MTVKSFKALEVAEEQGQYQLRIADRSIESLPPGDVLVRVHYSSLNYKDALSAKGNKGVTRSYPHTPGIDAAGVVEYSENEEWQPGDEVIVTGFDLGMNTSGGFAEYIRVPASWLVRLPAGLTLKEAMIYGTAGFTAGLSVAALLDNGLAPGMGLVAVSGATGGVGSVGVSLLAKLGFDVVAISSKESSHNFLYSIGASQIIPRSDVDDTSGRPLLKPKFAAALDTVGGNILSTLIKGLDYGGAVTTCGMVNGPELSTTVFPFILKAVKLIGIDSVEHPMDKRLPVWKRLATAWKPDDLEKLALEISLEDLPLYIEKISQGQMTGRAIVRI